MHLYLQRFSWKYCSSPGCFPREPAVLPVAILVALCVLLDPGMIQAATLRESLLLQLLPPESNELANVVLEIRSSVGGEWAGDFAADLLEMYRQFAGQQGWRFEVSSDRPLMVGSWL